MLTSCATAPSIESNEAMPPNSSPQLIDNNGNVLDEQDGSSEVMLAVDKAERDNILPFSVDEAAKAGLVFAEKIYREHLLNLSEDNCFRLLDYKLISCEIVDSSENEVTSIFRFAVKPVNEAYYTGFYTERGNDEYEGWLILRKLFKLERYDDDYWHLTLLRTQSNFDFSSLSMDFESFSLPYLVEYYLNADGAYSEGAGWELYRRFMEDPDTILACIVKTGYSACWLDDVTPAINVLCRAIAAEAYYSNNGGLEKFTIILEKYESIFPDGATAAVLKTFREELAFVIEKSIPDYD